MSGVTFQALLSRRPVENAIGQGVGTIITDIYTTNQSAGFDGTTNQAIAASAKGPSSGNSIGRYGKDLGSGNAKVITGVDIYGANDAGYLNGYATVTPILKASNTDPTTTSWAGTTIGSITPFTNANATLQKSSVGNANATAYRYAWIEISGTSVFGIAEVVLYQTS